MIPSPSPGADQALAALYREHYPELVRLAALLVRDAAAAEALVQDAFVAMHSRWARLRDHDQALSYLREAVVARSRSRLAGRRDGFDGRDGLDGLVAALGSLPPRQREAVVLRYYGNLSETQAAAAMRVRPGAVQSHTAHAVSALRGVLDRQA